MIIGLLANCNPNNTSRGSMNLINARSSFVVTQFNFSFNYMYRSFSFHIFKFNKDVSKSSPKINRNFFVVLNDYYLL